MKSPSIYHHAWHKLSNEQIVNLFDQTFGNSIRPATSGAGVQVTIAPNLTIVNGLRQLGTATLELLENRTGSTIYRIRETGIVYQLCQPNGDLFEFDDYDDYRSAEPIDSEMTIYYAKRTKFTVEKKDGKLYISHHEPPLFTAQWVGGMNGVDNIVWHEQPQSISEVAKLLRKAGAFMNSYFKTNP